MAMLVAACLSQRACRTFVNVLKTDAFRLVFAEDTRSTQDACGLDLPEAASRRFVPRVRAERSQGRTTQTTTDREEPSKLRNSNREPWMTHAILDDATVPLGKSATEVRIDLVGERRLLQHGALMVPARLATRATRLVVVAGIAAQRGVPLLAARVNDFETPGPRVY